MGFHSDNFQWGMINLKFKEGYKKRIISIVMVIVVVVASVWMFKQWKLLQNLIEEKSGYMLRRYQQQNRYLKELEYITAKIILTNEVSEETIKDAQYLNEEYLEYRDLPSYYRHGYFKNKIDDDYVEEFIRETNSFLKNLKRQRVKLTTPNLEFLKKVNTKAKELNSIKNKYDFSIDAEEYERLFYSEILAKAVNEMDDTFDIEWLKELDYERETNEKNLGEKPKPEDIYGKKVLSMDEAREAAQKFIGDFGEIEEHSDDDYERYEDDELDRDFDMDNGYEVEVHIQGGKIMEIRDHEWNWSIRENGRSFDESKINISREDAIRKLTDFLSKRGFVSLEIIEVKQNGPELEIRFAQAVDEYLNLEAEIEGKVDLTREGRLLELFLQRYWKGLAYDDSGYEQALKGYEKAKMSLAPGVVTTDEKLVGKRGEGYSLDFYWRFTTEYNGDEYYIYVDPQTGENSDVTKVQE